MSTIFRHRHATLDVIEIADYIAHDNVFAANKFMDSIEETLEDIRKFPGLGNLWEPPILRYPGLRWCPVREFPNHLIFYVARDSEPIVDIYRVLYGGRDLDAILNE